MAVAAEEHGREIVGGVLQAMRGGDWRAAEALMSRIYGKATETVVTHTPVSPEKALIASIRSRRSSSFCVGSAPGKRSACPSSSR
jgi:hypothetical protein